MFELVPSTYMRAVFRNAGFTLTDFQKATLIWNAWGKNRTDKLSALRELLETTGDRLLQRQIRERLSYEEELLRRFLDNAFRGF